MDIALVLGLAKVALEVFQDERQGRFLNQHDKILKEWQNEMALPDDQRSDLTLDRLLFESEQLARRIIEERNKKP